MNRHSAKAVIVWDFDGVLFDMERSRSAIRRSLVQLGIPHDVILSVLEEIRADGKHFSIGAFTKKLWRKNVKISERPIRHAFHRTLFSNNYYSGDVDRLLHRLSVRGFHQRVLSLGMSSFQHKKISSCGKDFRRHFDAIKVTTRPKYLELLKTRKKYPCIPLLFVDDTRENLELAKHHVPGLIPIHYSNKSGHAIKSLEEKILYAAQG